ncbi:Transcriptional regulator [Seminavis robusta]|uniref:Transcriptional regulator n=1 Tax=Seminavis robusta TaxID=568900 RepID=A0A9N8EGT7_9STRA|nr:Transcriptional regulator [Seminavis robusta]|eukprot:Sro924_g220830.1 Transcriptional regulator (1245) ;mRNA; r:16959-20798
MAEATNPALLDASMASLDPTSMANMALPTPTSTSSTSATTSTNRSTKRLDFGVLHQSGLRLRQHELNQLLQYASSTETRSPAVWMQAEAGVGKSALLQQFRDELCNGSSGNSSCTMKGRAVVMGGKFEERAAASEPFAALRDAVSELVEHFLNVHHNSALATTSSTATDTTESMYTGGTTTCTESQSDASEQADQTTEQASADQGCHQTVTKQSDTSYSTHDQGGNQTEQAPDQEEDHQTKQAGADQTVAEQRGWAEGLQQELGTALPLFLDILPALRRILPLNNSSLSTSLHKMAAEEEKDRHHADDDDHAFGTFNRREYRFERFRLGFRTLIRYTCSYLMHHQAQSSLVLLLDDWHSCDPDSLQIVKTLMEDPQRPRNFLLVAATRPIQDYPALEQLYQTMAQQQASEQEVLRIMDIPRWSVTEIADILTTLLERPHRQHQEDNDDILELAEIVQRKTQGNAFVVLQFLRLLERSGHIYHHHQQWHFDTHMIAQVDRISDNVSQVVAHEMEKNQRRRSALMVAASFGVSQFDVATIVHAVAVVEPPNNKEQPEGSSTTMTCSMTTDESIGDYEEYEDPYVVRQRVHDMSCELSHAALEGFVEEMAPGQFRFAHDRIRESAYSLLPEGQHARQQVHLRVGRQLRSWMDTQSELGLGSGTAAGAFSKESLLLHATKQLNAGADLIHDDWELLDLADLNYQAAALAARKTAFFSSMEYLQVGITHLGDDAWRRHYDRTLRFCVALTRMQYSCGLLDECWETGGGVIAHAKSFDDKSKIYHTQVLCLMQQGRMNEAMELVLDVLDVMGRPVPRKMVIYRVFQEYRKAQKFLKNSTEEELLNIPAVYDADLEMQLDFLQSLAETCFLSGKFAYVIYVSMRYLTLVAEQGNYPRSFFAYNLYASYFKAQMGDFAGAQPYAKLARMLSEKNKAIVPHFAARSEDMLIAYVDHWQENVRKSLAAEMDAFERLWAAGLIDTALMDASTLLQHFFAAGEHLDVTVQKCSFYSEAMQDFKQTASWYINASQHQAMLNLQGHSENPAVCTGTVMDAQACQESWKANPNLPAQYNFQFWSVVLGYHFGDLHAAKRHIKAMRSDLFEDGSVALVRLRLFYTGLVFYALCKDTGKGKYRRRARKASKQLQQWADKGSVNCKCLWQLLVAEDLASQRRSNVKMTVAAFERAIQAIEELEQCHHLALANQLAGSFLMSRQTPDGARAANTYLKTAVSLFEQWGASGIVRDLKARYPGAI